MMTRGSLVRIGIVAAVAVAIAVDSARNDETVFEVSDASNRPSSHVVRPSPIGTVAKPGMDAVTAANDPFAPRGWQAPPPPPPAAPIAAPPAVVAPVAPPVIEAPVAPALPYAFMGQFDDGGRQVVYLSRNEQTFVVTPGETLEGMYKVLAMDPRRIEFEHMPTGTKQVLTIPAPNN